MNKNTVKIKDTSVVIITPPSKNKIYFFVKENGEVFMNRLCQPVDKYDIDSNLPISELGKIFRPDLQDKLKFSWVIRKND